MRQLFVIWKRYIDQSRECGLCFKTSAWAHFQMLLSWPNDSIRCFVRLSVGPSISLPDMIELKSGTGRPRAIYGQRYPLPCFE